MTRLTAKQYRELLAKTAHNRTTAKRSHAIGQQMEQMATNEQKAVKTPKKTQAKEAKQLTQIKLWIAALGHQYTTEHRFHPVRRFRFDIALPDHKLAIEYEGINSSKSRHTSLTGFSRDTEKYNLAQLMGWTVLRYTTLNYHDVLRDVPNFFCADLENRKLSA